MVAPPDGQQTWGIAARQAHPLGQEDRPEQAPQPISDVLPLDWADVDVEDQEEEEDLQDEEQAQDEDEELPLPLWPDQVAAVNSIDTMDEAVDDFAEVVAVDDYAEAVDDYVEGVDDAVEAVADAVNSIDTCHAFMAAERAVYDDLNAVAAKHAANPASMEAAQLAVVDAFCVWLVNPQEEGVK